MDGSEDSGRCDSSTPVRPSAQGDVWVFAYGSLMWRPDFVPLENRPARLFGWRRALCILSTIYRGTDAAPGLVLGLDRGGSCLGRALKVAAAQWSEVRARLDARELPTGVYLPRFLPARLHECGTPIQAYAYVADRRHWQYWRGSPAEAVRLLRQGRGKAGTARDYLAQTVVQLSAMGIGAGDLHRLLERVDRGD